MKKQYLRSIAAISFAVLVLSGCNNGNETSTSADKPPSPAPTPTPTPTGYTLSVSVTGVGTVTSTALEINCGTDCSETYASGALVSLSASAGNGHSFASWGGACSGTAPACAVTMNAARSVSANFVASPTGAYLANTQFAGALTDDGFTVNDYQQNSAQIVTIDRVWDTGANQYANRNIFHPFCNDNYFGVRRMVAWPAAANRIFFLFTVRFGDATHPYTGATAPAPGCSGTTEARGHELKFPDIGSGPDRMIGKFNMVNQNLNWGLYLVRGVVSGQDPHSHPSSGLTFASNQLRTVQVMVEDNGASGDIVRIWYDGNQDFGAPDYNYVSLADLVGMDDLRGQSVRFDYGYRNHNVDVDQYFYVFDLRVSEQFITR
jgi:hypothetical protein